MVQLNNNEFFPIVFFRFSILFNIRFMFAEAVRANGQTSGASLTTICKRERKTCLQIEKTTRNNVMGIANIRFKNELLNFTQTKHIVEMGAHSHAETETKRTIRRKISQPTEAQQY